MELAIMIIIAIFVLSYRMQSGGSVYTFLVDTVRSLYNKYAPYTYQEVRAKTKELGQDYTPRQFLTQVILIGGGAAVVGYFYFYSIVRAIIYAVVAIMFIPYLSYLKSQKVYSEFIFEAIQVYCTNVINEFNTTQSFVKALEGVRDSGILEEPILSDVKKVIDMSYANGTIDEAVAYFDSKYPYYMVKNMHQLFVQITKEGAKDSGESLENMMQDIDTLVEGVYRDKMDRAGSHTKFITFGVALYGLAILVQALLNVDTYKTMINQFFVRCLLHGIIWINSYFIISGEKFYNEDTGAE
ncbi:MAG: hypothetical protein K5666_04860 [Bacilli bacterium]|nr:hypothetical protein [Bacilli bacterium]